MLRARGALAARRLAQPLAARAWAPAAHVASTRAVTLQRRDASDTALSKMGELGTDKMANLFQSLYGAGWGNFANYETRSKKLLSDQLKDSPTGLCSKSFFSRAVCPNDS